MRGNAEWQLEYFIERRHEKRVLSEGERRTEELWAESTRRAAEEAQRLNRVKWRLYHKEQARRLRSAAEALASHHEEAAARLEEPLL